MLEVHAISAAVPRTGMSVKRPGIGVDSSNKKTLPITAKSPQNEPMEEKVLDLGLGIHRAIKAPTINSHTRPNVKKNEFGKKFNLSRN